MPEIQNVNQGLVVLAVIALMILHQVLSIVSKALKEWWDHRKGNGIQGTMKKLNAAVDRLEASRTETPPPEHFERIKRVDENVTMIRENQEEHQRMMDRGEFACKIHGDHLQTIQRLGDDLHRRQAAGD